MRLLIVDDDVDIRRSLGQRLEEAGHQVTVEGDPERALQRAAAGTLEDGLLTAALFNSVSPLRSQLILVP